MKKARRGYAVQTNPTIKFKEVTDVWTQKSSGCL